MIKKAKGRKSSKRSVRAIGPAGRRGSVARRRKAVRRPGLISEPNEILTI